MSDVGKCYDNARMESFFATLKKEKIYLMNTKLMDMQEVEKAIAEYIVYYNMGLSQVFYDFNKHKQTFQKLLDTHTMCLQM